MREKGVEGREFWEMRKRKREELKSVFLVDSLRLTDRRRLWRKLHLELGVPAGLRRGKRERMEKERES